MASGFFPPLQQNCVTCCTPFVTGYVPFIVLTRTSEQPKKRLLPESPVHAGGRSLVLCGYTKPLRFLLLCHCRPLHSTSDVSLDVPFVCFSDSCLHAAFSYSLEC